MNADIAEIVAEIVAEWPEEAVDAEWLGAYYSECLSDEEREGFGSFGEFMEEVNAAIQ